MDNPTVDEDKSVTSAVPLQSPAQSKKTFRDKIKESTSRDDIFDSIQDSLLGTTFVEVPRVSRETIISVLQTHTDLIKGLRKDHVILHARVTSVHNETKENDRQIKLLQDAHDKARKDLITLFRQTAEFRKEMEELSEKVSELYVLKKQLADQKQFVDNLHSDFSKFNAEVSGFMVDTNSIMSNLKTNMTETQFVVKELKQYVDHFGDNLILSSSQITVDPQIGFSSKPISLSDTLKQCSNNFRHMTEKTDEHDGHIASMLKDIETKAPDSVLVNVNTLEKKVSTIEVHLQKEEEVGIGAIRKTCEELSDTVQSITTELADKVDRDNVNIIVHEKYEEIVQYLQDALQSSMEDENNFKKKADEISDLVAILSNSKADRTEINNMQELMVKSEALMKKIGSQMNIKDRLKDFISKKDLEAFLQAKVDRAEFDQQLSSLSTNARKSKKLTAAGGAHSTQVEDAINAFRPSTAGDSSGDGASAGGKNKMMTQSLTHFPVIALGKGLSAAGGGAVDGSADSPSSLGQRGANNNPSEFSNYVKNKKAIGNVSVAANSRSTSSLPGSNNAPGSFKMGAEGIGRLGTAGSSVASSTAGGGSAGGGQFINQNLSGTVNMSMASSAGGGGGRAGLASAGGAGVGVGGGVSGGGGSGGGFNNNGGGVGAGGGVGGGGGGGFRGGSGSAPGTAGLVGGSNPPDGYGRTEFPYVPAPPYVLDYPEQSALNDSLGFMKGPIVGGQFNVYPSKLHRKTPVSSKPLPTDDVEGKGLMVKGNDGHFYYTDKGQ